MSSIDDLNSDPKPPFPHLKHLVPGPFAPTPVSTHSSSPVSLNYRFLPNSYLPAAPLPAISFPHPPPIFTLQIFLVPSLVPTPLVPSYPTTHLPPISTPPPPFTTTISPPFHPSPLPHKPLSHLKPILFPTNSPSFPLQPLIKKIVRLKKERKGWGSEFC